MNPYHLIFGTTFLAGLIFAIINVKAEKIEIGTGVAKSIIATTLVIGLIFGVVISVGYMAMEATPNYQDTSSVDTIPIYSIHMNDGIHGSFFLGSGTVNSYTQYLFYKDSGTGGYLLDKVRTDGTVIFQDENEKPYLKVTKYYQYDTKTGKEYHTWSDTTTYEIHVPKGTIVEEYKL